MTHDELLAKIKDIWADDEQQCSKSLYALSAVVELHRPALDNEIDENSDNEVLGCAGCGYDFNYGTWETNYPCQTIQAIEKELL